MDGVLAANLSTEVPEYNATDTQEDGVLVLVLAEVSITILLIAALVAQRFRQWKYARYNLVKKLQVRFFRSHHLNLEGKKFFGNLNVQEKIFIRDDLAAKKTVIQIDLPTSEVLKPTKIICQYVSLSDKFKLYSSEYHKNKVYTAELYPKGKNGNFFCRIPIEENRSYVHIKCLDVYEMTTSKYWKVDNENRGWAFIKIWLDQIFTKWVLAKPGEIDLAAQTTGIHKKKKLKKDVTPLLVKHNGSRR